MPFTFAHPAAAAPLTRLLGRYGVLSALVIGSLSPDVAYFVPLSVVDNQTTHIQSHSLAGLFWFCLPVSVLGYALFHTLLKGPLLGLLPDRILRRLCAHALRFRSLPPVSRTAVIVSSLSGASTHLLWDSFTHGSGLAVQVFPILGAYLFDIGGYRIYMYKLLQHGSTCAGLSLLLWWSWRSLRPRAPRPASLPIMFSTMQRVLAIASIVVVTGFVAGRAGVQSVGTLTGVGALKTFTSAAVFAGLPALTVALILYSTGWHVWRSRLREPLMFRDSPEERD